MATFEGNGIKKFLGKFDLDFIGAQHPSTVIWENFSITLPQMRNRKIMVYSLIILISLAYFLFFFKIFHYDQEMQYLVQSPI